MKNAFKLLLFFIFLELFLWATGRVNLLLQERQNKERLQQGRAYRIICVGDSNTAVGGEEGYVRQLDLVLNERSGGMSFEVLNKGLGAASSDIILGEVEGWLEQYKPDMVVSMMGANDRVDLVSGEGPSLLSVLNGKLRCLRAYRLFVSLLGKVKGSFAEKALKPAPGKNELTQKYRKASPGAVKLLYYAMNLKDKEQWKEAMPVLKRLVYSGIEDPAFLQRARMELGDCYNELGMYKELAGIWSELLEAYPYDVYATDRIQWFCRDKKAEKEIFPMLHNLLLKHPYNRAFTGLLGMCYDRFGNTEMAGRYLNKYRELNKDGDNPDTRRNYLKLAALLNEKKIKGVFVEYPARSAAPLKRTYGLIEDRDNIIVVDNEDLFKRARDPRYYGEYFTDRNYEDIGHCTPRGNRMLAENIAGAILKYLSVGQSLSE